jgi:hypothetical protein
MTASTSISLSALRNRVGVVAFVGKQGVDLVADHAQERREPLDVMCLSRREREAKRPAFAVAARMDFGREAAARTAKGLLILSPPFFPAAQ